MYRLWIGVFTILIILSVDLTTAWAQQITVFDVKKNLKLTKDEKTYRDYYINAGEEEGLRAGMIVTVERRQSTYDHHQNMSPGELRVAVGKLKIIHVQKGLSVGRLHSRFSADNRPMLDYNYIMIGDSLNLSSAYMDRGRKNKQKRKASSLQEPSIEAISIKAKEPETVKKTEAKAELPQNLSLPTIQ
ncbi:MAG: hypothetical protein MK008_07755 [Bdellovibrionales bacterium]|nr:hypothetical protein [Bdellovibrionales bacterium]